MTRSPTPPNAAGPEATAFAEACAQVVGTIIDYLFRRHHGLGPTPLAMLILHRIIRANQRVQRLMARLANGTWQAVKPRVPRASRQPDPTATPRPNPPYISQSKGWIGQCYGYFIRGYFLQFEHALTKPESLALLADLPPEALKSLGRALRPTCRLFGITPPECPACRSASASRPFNPTASQSLANFVGAPPSSPPTTPPAQPPGASSKARRQNSGASRPRRLTPILLSIQNDPRATPPPPAPGSLPPPPPRTPPPPASRTTPTAPPATPPRRPRQHKMC